MSSQYILALDLGTTSARAIIFDAEGSTVSLAQKAYSQNYPNPGWVEQDPFDLSQTQIAVAQQALQQANLTASEIAALGITNQRESTVVWDRASGQPIYPAIIWQDRRTATMCEQWKADGVEDFVCERTGLHLDPYFSASKLRWILDRVPNAQERAKRGELAFGTLDSWLIWSLTKGQYHVTDASNASRSLLFNLDTGTWDDELLHLFKIPPAILPAIVESSGAIAAVADPEDLAGITIAGIAGDQQAGLFGQTCFDVGSVKNTYGTGCFMLMNTGTRPVMSKNLLTTVAWQIDGQLEYAVEGAIFTAGAAIQWLQDELQLIEDAEECDRLATSVLDTGGVYFVPALTGLAAPYWNAHARGMLLGLARGTNRAHICRAALEAIAYQVGDAIDCMKSDSALPLKELRVDGGGANCNFLMQRQADILGISILRPKTTEATALGAAFLAGLGVGFWPDRAALRSLWKPQTAFHPTLSLAERETALHQWRQAVALTLQWKS
ncbi:glycerol kinase GlpK [Altericista sp. CCNU0014]|uniref:glycerol kinase GlpK n=1 Tax=Altericista sp. CCNU0014 TaxID=3082949 RepID=UPI00384E625C